MTRSKLFSVIIIGGLLLTVKAFSEEAKSVNLSPAQKDEVVSIVRDVLKNEPELIESSLRQGMEKKEAAAQEESKNALKTEKKALFEDSEDPFLGNPKGTVQMVVFMDPYCGYCRKFQAILLSVVKERKDLKVIYKVYPILSAESKKAAEEELAANKIGRFQDFHEALYESSVRSRKDRLDLAEKNKIDVAKMKENIPGIGKAPGAAQIEKHLERNAKLGAKIGIHGTPAFIIGESLNPGFVEKDALIAMLDQNAKK